MMAGAMRYPRWMKTALFLAAVASVTALADDSATDRPPPPPAVEGGDGEGQPFLNTREWKFAAFFNLVKQRVAAKWDPMAAARERDPTGTRYFSKDRTTTLSVVLNPQGGITEIKVARSSGLDFLDQTAIDAFEKAQPFVNPPPGLADSRGDIRFTFGFHVSTDGGGIRSFRGLASRPEGPRSAHRDPSKATLDLRAGHATGTLEQEAFYARAASAVAPKWKALFAAERWKLVERSRWRPDAPDTDPLYADEWETGLVVTLDPLGRIVKVVVTHPCGLDFLDRLAVDSIWHVKTFESPPREQTDPGTGIHFPVRFGLSGSTNADWAKLEVAIGDR
jgi:TonB family protein